MPVRSMTEYVVDLFTSQSFRFANPSCHSANSALLKTRCTNSIGATTHLDPAVHEFLQLARESARSNCPLLRNSVWRSSSSQHLAMGSLLDRDSLNSDQTSWVAIFLASLLFQASEACKTVQTLAFLLRNKLTKVLY